MDKPGTNDPQAGDEAQGAQRGGMPPRGAHLFALVENAVTNRDVKIAFQPVVQALDPSRAAFYEAFARVVDPAGRPIPASDFMPATERTELGRMLDCIALDAAFDHLAQDPRLRLAVNMSARSITHGKWREVLDRGLATDPTAGERLILEINEESAMLVPDTTRAFMEEMQSANISFAFDDFGAGLTRFGQLPTFPVDMIKIDGRFVSGCAFDPEKQVLVRAIRAMAASFDLFTVAEEVESAGDAAFLTDIGVDCLQGYYFAEPTLAPPWLENAETRRA